jgi:hypothetical protein
MGLNEEIAAGSRQLKTDGYPMSIGELVNLYKDGELDLHPDFQRFFRWDEEQKSRLIESILLGIPLPSVFVFQRKDGVWDVIDGVQRLSTIFQFLGILKDSSGNLVVPLRLRSTRYLPSLKDKAWERPDLDPNDPRIISSDQRIAFRRSKIDIKIIKSDSTDQSKYDLFQRLNTGGTPATEQEIRNCILIMQNKPMFEWLSGLSKEAAFTNTLNLSDRLLDERYEVELALRFILLKSMSENKLKGIKELDLASFLTENMIEAAKLGELDYQLESEVFTKTFTLLYATLEDDAFKKFDVAKGRFIGSFSVSGFEAVALGLGFQFSNDLAWLPKYDLIERVKELWGRPEFKDNVGSGISSSTRIPRIVPFARGFFG